MDFLYEDNRIFLKDDFGKIVAQVTFPEMRDGIVNIDHTYVDSSLSGRGVAGKLLEAVSEKLRCEGKTAYPTCSYAVKWYEKNKEYSDVCTDRPSK